MKKLFLIPAMFTAFAVQAQITLNQSDFAVAGDTVYMATDNSVTGLAVGNASATAQTWNFTSLTIDAFDTLLFVNPAAAPGGADFPNANVALITGSAATFFNNTASGAAVLGNGGGFGGFAFSAPYNPPFNLLTYPTGLGTTINQNYSFDVTEYIGIDTTVNVPLVGNITIQLDSLRLKRLGQVDIDFDAFGTMQLPIGNYPALRCLNTQTNNDTTFAYLLQPVSIPVLGINLVAGWNVITNDIAASISIIAPGIFLGNTTGIVVEKSYDWFANNGDYRIVSVVLDPANNNPQRAEFKSDPIFLSTPASALLPNVNVYPNPSSEWISLQGVPEGFAGTLHIVDMNGKTVYQTVYNGQSLISVSALANGMYSVRLANTAGQLVYADKIQVVK
ncbi:MAG: T9SS type A sorting domain-containing protein [Flavobacteriales bacterium]|nr:T9SS type A sorting domain-containing protein [Flavobacteriales bacterium]